MKPALLKFPLKQLKPNYPTVAHIHPSNIKGMEEYDDYTLVSLHDSQRAFYVALTVDEIKANIAEFLLPNAGEQNREERDRRDMALDLLKTTLKTVSADDKASAWSKVREAYELADAVIKQGQRGF